MNQIYKLIENKEYSEANRRLTNLMNRHQCARYSIFAAELSLPIWEAKYPKDQRPRKAIETAKLWLVGKATEEECRKAANEAWNAADAAAYAANAAAYAAYAANAAYAAAYYAATAAYAAETAAYAADWSANAFQGTAKEEAWIKILEYGL